MFLYYFTIFLITSVSSLVAFVVHKFLYMGSIPFDLLHNLDIVFMSVLVSTASLITLIRLALSKEKWVFTNFDVLLVSVLIATSVGVSENRLKQLPPVSVTQNHHK